MRNARARLPMAAALAVLATACGGTRADIRVPPARMPAASTSLDEHLLTDEPKHAARITGRVRLLSRADTDVDLGPIVVYLVPSGRAGDRHPGSARAVVEIVSLEQAFAPALAVVPTNRPAVLVNGGPLNHRVFAADLDPDRVFDLPPGGRSTAFRLPPTGPIRFFCSLHADETFVVFSRDTAFMTVVERDEPFSLGPLGPGRYTLVIWSARVEGPVREVVVDGFTRVFEEIWIDPLLVRGIRTGPGIEP